MSPARSHRRSAERGERPRRAERWAPLMSPAPSANLVCQCRHWMCNEAAHQWPLGVTATRGAITMFIAPHCLMAFVTTTRTVLIPSPCCGNIKHASIFVRATAARIPVHVEYDTRTFMIGVNQDNIDRDEDGDRLVGMTFGAEVNTSVLQRASSAELTFGDSHLRERGQRTQELRRTKST